MRTPFHKLVMYICLSGNEVEIEEEEAEEKNTIRISIS